MSNIANPSPANQPKPMIQCHMCPKQCSTPDAMKKHKQRDHRDALDLEHNKKKEFRCGKCDAPQRDAFNLKKHEVKCKGAVAAIQPPKNLKRPRMEALIDDSFEKEQIEQPSMMKVRRMDDST